MKENTAAIHAQVPVDVATYLLNEKRSEIFGIEARLKVNVLLIPNPNLATPNYNVERLRHDAPQLDEQKPSYEMVTVPDEEPVGLPTKSPQAVAPRPEPLVKGIRPEQPAPMAVEAPAAPARAAQPQQSRAAATPRAEEKKGGLIDTLFGWLKKPAAPAAATPAAKPALEERAPREGQRQRDGQRRDGRRDGRGGGEGKRAEGPRDGRRGSEQQRGDRRPDSQQPRRDSRAEPREGRAENRDNRNEGRENREGRTEGREPREGRRDENRPQQNRPQRAPEAPRAEHAADPQAPRLESHPVPEAGSENGEGGGRRRRRRGGRGGDRADRPPRDNAQATAPGTTQDEVRASAPERREMPYDEPVAEAAPRAERAEAAPRAERAEAPPRAERSEVPPRAERTEAPTPQPEPAVAAIAPAAFHAVSEHDLVESEPAHRPNRRRHQGAPDTAQVQELQLVETQAPAMPASDIDDENLPRRSKPRRRRSGAAPPEPLQMVETQGDSTSQAGDGTAT